MKGQFFIHIGLPKTATTFLQRHVFPRIEDVEFLGKAKCLDLYKLYNSDKDKLLVSHEHLLACPSVFYSNGWLHEFSTRLAALACRFPEAKIMISLRAHEALLTSYYKEYISKPGRVHLTLEEFFDVKEDQGLVKRQDLYFARLIELIESHFRERPFVFLFEDVIHNPSVFLRDLSIYLDEETPDAADIQSEKVNPGVGYYQAKILVKLNQLDAFLKKVPVLPDLYNPVFRKLSIYPDRLCRKHLAFISSRPLLLTERQREFIQDHYTDDWQHVVAYVADSRRVHKDVGDHHDIPSG